MGRKFLWMGWILLPVAMGAQRLHRMNPVDWCGGCHAQHEAGGPLLLSRISPRVFLDARTRVFPDSVSLFCLSCHGPGSDTSEAVPLGTDLSDDHPVGITMEAARARGARLFQTVRLPLWKGAVGCHSCHDPHARKTPTLREDDPLLCRECHALPVSRGHVDLACGSCHTAHSAPWVSLLRSGEEELCVTCHAPARVCREAAVEDCPECAPALRCGSCHTIHGGKRP